MIGLGARLALAAVGGIERRLSVVLFHRVMAAPDTLLVHEPDVRRFAEQMRWLSASFTILPLVDALERLYAGNLPAGALAVTFDDGYRDNAQNALPVLRQLGLTATFFVTTRYLEGGMMWNDRVVEAVRQWPDSSVDLRGLGLGNHDLRRGHTAVMDELLAQLKYRPYGERDALADELYARSGARNGRMMMDEQEIRTLHAAGMEIGGHTVSHPILCALEPAAAASEILDNKLQLEAIIGAPLVTFAYPNGQPQRDYDARHVAMLRACGYRHALTTSSGAATAATPPYQIPRFTPWDRRQSKYLARMLVNYFRQPQVVAEAA